MAAQSKPTRTYSFDKLLQAAGSLADNCLRAHVTLPAKPDAPNSPIEFHSDVILPACSCAFRGCTWQLRCSEPKGLPTDHHHVEHPWDRELRQHVLSRHHEDIVENVPEDLSGMISADTAWAIYKQALAVQERQGFPIVGVPVDRRSFEYTLRVYNDDRIRSLMCCACACICLDTGGARSRIEFVKGSWLLQLPNGSLKNNFSYAVFRRLFSDRLGGYFCNLPSTCSFLRRPDSLRPFRLHYEVPLKMIEFVVASSPICKMFIYFAHKCSANAESAALIRDSAARQLVAIRRSARLETTS